MTIENLTQQVRRDGSSLFSNSTCQCLHLEKQIHRFIPNYLEVGYLHSKKETDISKALMHDILKII